MLTLQEKQKLTQQLKSLKEKRDGLDKGSGNKLDENSSVSDRLKNLQRNQIRLQSKIARMKKNGTVLQSKDGMKGKPGKVMMDKKTSAEDVTNKAVGKHSGGQPGKVMLDKKMKAKDASPTKLGKYKETKAYEGFDPDLLECIKRRDAWDTLASHYIYEADEIYNDNQSPFQGKDDDDDFGFDVDIDADGEEEGDDEESDEETDLVQELKLLNQKINQLKDFADSITPDELKDAEEQQSKLQQIVDDEGDDGEESDDGEEQGFGDEQGFDPQGGESQGIEGLDDEEAMSLQGEQGFQSGGEQGGGQNFKNELGADALAGMEMGGGKKKGKKKPEIAMEDVREAILRRNFWDATAKNLIRLEEYCNDIKENDEKEKAAAIAAIELTSGADERDIDKAKDELRKNLVGEADDPFLPAEAIRVELSSDSGVDSSSVGDLSTTETCACGVPGCNNSCSTLSVGADVYPSFTNESDKRQINLQQQQIKKLQEQLKKVKNRK